MTLIKVWQQHSNRGGKHRLRRKTSKKKKKKTKIETLVKHKSIVIEREQNRKLLNHRNVGKLKQMKVNSKYNKAQKTHCNWRGKYKLKIQLAKHRVEAKKEEEEENESK